MEYSLGEIAERFALHLQGDAQRRVSGVCSLAPGKPGHLAFLADPGQATALADTRAEGVIVATAHAAQCPCAALVADNPKLAYAHVATLFARPLPVSGVHPSAQIDDSASVHASASVGANVVVGAGAHIAENVCLQPGCVIGCGAMLGAGSRIGANACIGVGVRLGQRVGIGAGAIIGERGFGLVRDGQAWLEIPQLGGVDIGNDVEIGAGCTIDRGAIEDTVVEEGVKLDDQVHIAHNCVIGAHTVIAGCVGVAGSCRIGRHCVIGGGVGIGDHVHLADGVVLTGASQVPSDINQAGVYSSTLRAMPVAQWNKRLALLRRLDRLAVRVRDLEQMLQKKG